MATLNDANQNATEGPKSVLIVAAEASSSLYAQRLIEHWRSTKKTVKAFGVGSQAMADLGFECIGRSEDMAVVGLQEVISHWSIISNAYHELLRQADERKPKVALLLDYPDFNLRLAKDLKKRGIPVVYYISPQIWAWRQSRVHTIKELVDKMLVLFPFEEEFYQKYNVPVRFVGHPLLDEIDDKFFDHNYRQMRRSRYGIAPDEKLLGLMPGSRNSELKHHLELQLKVAEKLTVEDSNIKTALFVAPTFSVEQIQQRLPSLNFSLITIKDEPFEMIHIADAILCASGTATLMVGLMERAMVIMYRMNMLTAWMAKMFVTATKHFGMINLVLNDRVVPEFFQEQASVEMLSDALRPMLQNANVRQELQAKLHQARYRLGDKGATVRVAQELEEYLK